MLKNKKYSEEMLSSYSLDASSEIVEAYNTLVNNIIHLPLEDNCKVIAVTSATYGEGKTAIAINLAKALANNLLDKKILLVDADFRNSKVSEFIGYSEDVNSNSLSSYLEGYVENPQFLHSSNSNLDYLFAGAVKNNPAGLVRSDKMVSALNIFTQGYDYVIIDTPPINEFSDALFLADRVNGYIMAVRRKISKISSIDFATDRITNSGAEILGFVYSE